MLLKIEITKIGLQVDYIPIVRTDKGTRLAEEQEADKILSDFQKRSKEIQEDGLIEEMYKKFSERNLHNYLRHPMGFCKWKSRIDRKLLNGLLLKKKMNKEQLLAVQIILNVNRMVS